MSYAVNDDLHDAARMGDLAAIQRLLVDGADPEDWSDQDDAPALVVAAASGHAEVVHLLLDSGASIEGCMEYGETALHVVAYSGRTDMCQLLLERGAQINAMSECGTPLAFAAQAGQVDCVRFLLEAGADIAKKDELFEQTALDWAREKGHAETVAVLEAAEWNKTHDAAGLPLTHGAFVHFIWALSTQHEETDLSLEHYLRALWALLQEHGTSAPSYPLFARLLSDAFTFPFALFQDEWLAHTAPYDEKGHKKMRDSFEALDETLLFQIADLHRMGEDIWGNSDRYFGIDSPSGNRWYNFEPAAYLSCAASGLQSHGEHATILGSGWRILLSVLELGRVYE